MIFFQIQVFNVSKEVFWRFWLQLILSYFFQVGRTRLGKFLHGIKVKKKIPILYQSMTNLSIVFRNRPNQQKQHKNNNQEQRNKNTRHTDFYVVSIASWVHPQLTPVFTRPKSNTKKFRNLNLKNPENAINTVHPCLNKYIPAKSNKEQISKSKNISQILISSGFRHS